MTSDTARFVGDIPHFYDRCLGPVLFQAYAEDLSRRVILRAPRNVLEVAAGTGIVTRVLRDRLHAQARLTATDLNAPMLEAAREKFRPDEEVRFEPADALNLTFPDESFDCVVCQFGLMFFPDKLAALRETRRVLKPHGRYLFSVHGRRGSDGSGDGGVRISGAPADAGDPVRRRAWIDTRPRLITVIGHDILRSWRRRHGNKRGFGKPPRSLCE